MTTDLGAHSAKVTCYDAVEKAWTLTVKARALCPAISESEIGTPGYMSPDWYQKRGAAYFVNPARPLTADDIEELRQSGGFVNRSFVISMAAILEACGVVRSGDNPDRNKKGGKHAQLTKWLRNLFAHGEVKYNPRKPKHVRTRNLLKKVFPKAVSGESDFVTSIDGVLEPLKDGVLEYISEWEEDVASPVSARGTHDGGGRKAKAKKAGGS